ncbi:MAG: hypothetical protein ACKVXR_00505 [Planctomycetota bacterium]
MRIALVLVSLCLVLALGAIGLFVALSPGSTPMAAASTEAPRAATARGTTPDGPQDPADEVLARMDALAREVDDLRAQVAALEAGAAREPAVVAAAQTPPEGSAATYAAVHREAILQVIEDDRLTQQRKREEEQRARDLQAALARAERTAKKFGLDAEQQKSLADVYILERAKMEDLRTQFRDQGGMGADPEQARTAFTELRDWRLTELSNRLGEDLAQQINKSEFERAEGRRGNRGQSEGGGAAPERGGF